MSLFKQMHHRRPRPNYSQEPPKEFCQELRETLLWVSLIAAAELFVILGVLLLR